MTVPAEQREVADYLRRLAGSEPIETHISLVFLGSDTVWKLKKSVRLSFLDFTRLEDRHHFAEREFALNAPHAPGLYRDVVPVVRRPDGSLALGHEGDAPIVDWILRMARVPADDFLDHVAAAGALTEQRLDSLADAVATYHAALPPLPAARSDVDWIIAGNERAALDAELPADRVARWRAAAVARLHAIRGLLAGRAGAGLVRRAHGDLHLSNMCLWHGRPVPFDALEFDEALATIDLGYDLAFLLMDLEFHLGRPEANRVMNRYIARTGDVGLLAPLPLFLSLRALIRAHVEAKIGRMAIALRYLDTAEACLAPTPAVVVAIGGLQGTGKSTLARALAPDLGNAPGAVILRSDDIRKRRHGVMPEERLPPSAYTEAVSTDVFATLGEMVRTAAEGGHAVIADATFMAPAHRALVREAAQGAGVPFLGVWLTAPLDLLEARVAARQHDASDATVDVLRRAARAKPGAGEWLSVESSDATATVKTVVANLRAIL